MQIGNANLDYLAEWNESRHRTWTLTLDLLWRIDKEWKGELRGEGGPDWTDLSSAGFLPICRRRARERGEGVGGRRGELLKRRRRKKKRNPVFTLSVSERIIKVAWSRGRQTELVWTGDLKWRSDRPSSLFPSLHNLASRSPPERTHARALRTHTHTHTELVLHQQWCNILCHKQLQMSWFISPYTTVQQAFYNPDAHTHINTHARTHTFWCFFFSPIPWMGERAGPFLHSKHSISIRVLGVCSVLCDSDTAALWLCVSSSTAAAL